MIFEVLAAGGRMPKWVTALERATFGKPWHQVGPKEWAILAPPSGYATWSVTPEIQEAELLRVAVVPLKRGTGLGRALLRESEARLRAQGITTFLLEVRVSNASARSLYASEDWREEGLRRGYYPDGEDAVLYRKKLG